MSPKSPPDDTDPRVVVVIDGNTMKKIKKLAAQYGIEPSEVIVELLRMESSERPEGVTLH